MQNLESVLALGREVRAVILELECCVCQRFNCFILFRCYGLCPNNRCPFGQRGADVEPSFAALLDTGLSSNKHPVASRCLDRGECRHLAKIWTWVQFCPSSWSRYVEIKPQISEKGLCRFAGVSRRNKGPWMQTLDTLTASLVAIFSGCLFARTLVQTRCLCLGPLLALPSQLDDVSADVFREGGTGLSERASFAFRRGWREPSRKMWWDR